MPQSSSRISGIRTRAGSLPRTTSIDAPYPISHYYAMPDRFIRIQEMLTAREKLGVEDFKAMQDDFYVVLAREWVPRFLNPSEYPAQRQ